MEHKGRTTYGLKPDHYINYSRKSFSCILVCLFFFFGLLYISLLAINLWNSQKPKMKNLEKQTIAKLLRVSNTGQSCGCEQQQHPFSCLTSNVSFTFCLRLNFTVLLSIVQWMAICSALVCNYFSINPDLVSLYWWLIRMS